MIWRIRLTNRVQLGQMITTNLADTKTNRSNFQTIFMLPNLRIVENENKNTLPTTIMRIDTIFKSASHFYVRASAFTRYFPLFSVASVGYKFIIIFFIVQ